MIGTHSRNNHSSESNPNFSNCFGTDGYNFFSIFIDGITTMMHFQVNQSGAVGSTTELQDTYRKDSLPLVEVSKKPKKESQSKKEAMPPLLFFFSHLLKQVTITNMNLNIIGSLHKKDHRNTSNYVEYHSGISIGLKKIGVVSTTDNASPTATSCLDFQALSTGLFGAMHLKEIGGVTMDSTYGTNKSTYIPTPLLLGNSSTEVVNVFIPNFTALWTTPKKNKRMCCTNITSNNFSSFSPYQLLTAILVTSPLSSNDSNMMMEDLLPPTLLQDVELRLGVTNAAFLVETLLPNVIDCIQLITRRRSTSLPPQKQQKEAGTISKHSKQSTVVFPIKEAWLGCALKFIITDDANRPSSSSSKSEYGPWVCHTVVRASFRTTTGIISIPFKHREAISSLQVSSSNPEIMNEGQVVPNEPESVKLMEDYKLDSISTSNPSAQILSMCRWPIISSPSVAPAPSRDDCRLAGSAPTW